MAGCHAGHHSVITKLVHRHAQTNATKVRPREKEMFYLTTHSTHFIYGYMASDIWLRTILIVRKETRCRHIAYSYRLTARVLLYAPSHRRDNTYHGLCYTSCGALAGTRNSSMDPHHEGSIRRPIAPWANALPLSYVPLLGPSKVRKTSNNICLWRSKSTKTCKTCLLRRWNNNRRFSVHTVRNGLKAAKYRARRPLKRLQLTDVVQGSSRLKLGEGSIGPMSVGCYCGLLTVGFVLDRKRVCLLLNMFNMIKLPFSMGSFISTIPDKIVHTTAFFFLLFFYTSCEKTV